MIGEEEGRGGVGRQGSRQGLWERVQESKGSSEGAGYQPGGGSLFHQAAALHQGPLLMRAAACL